MFVRSSEWSKIKPCCLLLRLLGSSFRSLLARVSNEI